MTGKPNLDPFLLFILGSVALGFLLPVQGDVAGAFDWITKAAIFLLFLGYGARLSTAQALDGLRNWRLHLTILACTFAVFPLLGFALRSLSAAGVNQMVVVGLVFLTIVPSTVQSSITFTSIAGGNIAGAIVSATTSNIVGVVLTPLLAMLLLPSTEGIHIDAATVGNVTLQLLLPFILGQVARRWVGDAVETHRARLKVFDQLVICMVVYGAFSEFRVAGTWREVSLPDLAVMVVVSLALLAFMLWFTWNLAGWLGFDRGDRIATLMCGTKKSLATGVPMASVMFAATGVGLIVLPLMIFHQAQLMVCSWIAGRLGRDAAPAS